MQEYALGVKKFVIIDGNALVHRCYHAVPKTLTTPEGKPSNAVYGFTSILLGILEVEKPEYLATAWDMHGPTFRDGIYTEYKAKRLKTDDDLIAQFPLVRSVLESLSIPIFEREGLEADDFLGIVATDLVKKQPDVQILIVTGDKDALQLVEDRITVVSPVSGYTKVKRYDRAAVKDKMGVWPEQVPDFKGLAGDSSDNLPGVVGIGDKTAAALLEQFGTLEGIYEHLEEVSSEKVREKLRAQEASARMCKQVATIIREDGVQVDLEAAEVHRFNMETVRRTFQGLGFRSNLARIERLNKAWEGLRVNEQQGSLF